MKSIPPYSLLKMTKGRKVNRIQMTTLSEAREMDMDFMFTGWGNIPVGSYRPNKQEPVIIDSTNRKEIFGLFSKFYTDDALVRIMYFDGDKTSTGKDSNKKNAIKSFQTIEFGFSTPKSTIKISDTVREYIELNKSDDGDYSNVFNWLVRKYGNKSIRMYTSDFKIYEARNLKWFNNNIRTYFEYENEGKTLNLIVTMLYDNEVTGASDEFIHFTLMEGNYLKEFRKLKENRNENISDYYSKH